MRARLLMPDPRPPPDPPLSRYRRKRDFGITPEPDDAKVSRRRGRPKPLSFVVQKHWARRLHYDFRLELNGVMLSWAVPRGPSYDPAEKRMAVHVEDHPVSYGSFEGAIPARQYGAGKVIVWDRGSWEPVGDPDDGMREGKLVFRLHGEKLAGLWELVRISKRDARQDQWMLFKKRDEWARPHAEYDVIAALPDSVVEQPLGPVEEREPRATATRDGTTPVPIPIAPDLALAIEAKALPAKLAPQLATLAATAPGGPGWVVEPKFDGYRILARIDAGRVRLFTRNGHDWSDKMKSLGAAVKALGTRRSWLDGEIVVMNDRGLPDFNALQNALDSDRSEAIVYFVFDAPFLDGKDLRKVPLSSRRALLRRLFDEHAAERVRYSEDFDAPPAPSDGSSRRWSSRWNSPSGPPTATSGIRPSAACASTRRRSRSSARKSARSPLRPPAPSRARSGSAIPSGSSILPAASARSTWCATTKAWPTGSCRISPAARPRWCARPRASAASSSSRSIRKRACRA